ncbi:MAG: hypothetical protein M3325_18365 [Actinomycetota bacterium]|nr:hypothetical protein [Actinomycetota bacterium]
MSMFIIIATAAALPTRSLLTSAAQTAQALRPVACQFAAPLFGLGLLGRGDRGGKLSIAPIPRRPAIPRPVHRPSTTRRGHRAATGQAHNAARAGAGVDHHARPTLLSWLGVGSG